MKRLLVLWYLAIVVFALIVLAASRAEADHSGPWLPVYNHVGEDITALPAQHRALERGYVTYCFDATAAEYPAFRTQAAQTVAAAYAMIGINGAEVPFDGDCDIRNSMPPDSTFVTTCGQGAAACIYYWSLPVTIYYRRSLGYTDWRSTFCHEGLNSGHFMGLHEEYNDRNFTSNGRYWTCMDFGTFVWQATEWDRDRIWNSWTPDRPSAVGLRNDGNGWVTATWTQRRADEGAAHAFGIPENTNATRMAFGLSATRDGAIEWVGNICGRYLDYCNTKYGDGQRGFDAAWQGCIWGRAEAPATYRTPQLTRGDSADGYWFLFGCRN